jgi:alkylation response protein AidB-like acyl-CoA dehydrogenase
MEEPMLQTTNWTAVAQELGAEFAGRSAQHDEDDSFVDENYAALKARGAFKMGVPLELGGGGASHAELCAMIRDLAHHCSSSLPKI